MDGVTVAGAAVSGLVVNAELSVAGAGRARCTCGDLGTAECARCGVALCRTHRERLIGGEPVCARHERELRCLVQEGAALVLAHRHRCLGAFLHATRHERAPRWRMARIRHVRAWLVGRHGNLVYDGCELREQGAPAAVTPAGDWLAVDLTGRVIGALPGAVPDPVEMAAILSERLIPVPWDEEADPLRDHLAAHGWPAPGGHQSWST